jgi:hypothetical protein
MKKLPLISRVPAALAVFTCLACLALAACGKGDPLVMTGTGGIAGGFGGATGGSGMGDPSQLLPIKTGNSWTYLVTDENGVPTPKTQTVMEMGPVGGSGPNAAVMAYRFVTRKGVDAMDETISWQARVGTRVVRYREQAYMASAPHALELEEYWDPFKLRVDETAAHMTAGATWVESDQETKLPVGGTQSTMAVEERWTVNAERQAVTVQGKSYEVMIVTKAGSSQKTYWWARGIGKVKEIGVNQTEELLSYSIQP